MKTKTRSILHPSPGYRSSTATSFFERVSSGVDSISGRSAREESISWSSPTRTSSLTGKPLSNTCSHRKLESAVHPVVATSSGLGYSTFGVQCVTPSTYRWIFSGGSAARVWAYDPHGIPNVDSFGDDLINAMSVKKLDAFEALALDVNRALPNVALSILELKDLPGTASQAVSAILTLLSAIRAQSTKAAASRVIRSLTLGSLASAKLWYDYGVMPTVRDWNSVWSPIFRGRFFLSRPVVKDVMALRAPWSVEYYDGRSSGAPLGASPYLVGGTVSGSTMFAGCVKTPGAEVTQSRGLITEVNAYINSQLNLWPARASRVIATGMVYGRLVTKRLQPASAIEIFEKGLDQHCLSQATWEAIPLSFLVDWVVNIGEWIRLLDRYEASLKVVQQADDGIWCTTKLEYEHYARVPTVTASLPQQGTSASHAALYYEVSPQWNLFEVSNDFSRTRYTPGFVSPRYFTLGGFHVDTALALLISKLHQLKI